MTTTIEVLDALPGCGKTTAIFKYMAENQSTPWLYLSPLAKEVNERVNEECIENNIEFFVPREEHGLLGEQVLTALQEGLNIACTHALMMRFTHKHIEAIRDNGYSIVCDEELNLITSYSISKEDVDFLMNNNLIEIKPEDGRVVFKDQTMSTDARYGDMKLCCDMECLYAAKRSTRMMVTQVSTRLIRCASRFILLTYNYQGSIMQSFMTIKGYDYKPFNVPLFVTTEQARSKLKELVMFVDTTAVQNIRSSYTLSKSWWTLSSTVKQKDEVAKAIRSVIQTTKVPKDLCFYTLPKDSYSVASFNTKFIGKDNFLACSTRSTNDYNHKQLAVHAYNLYPNTAVRSYIQDMGGHCNEDVYALNMLLQWVFRGCVRKGEPMHVAIMSARMNKLFKLWLLKNKDL